MPHFFPERTPPMYEPRGRGNTLEIIVRLTANFRGREYWWKSLRVVHSGCGRVRTPFSRALSNHRPSFVPASSQDQVAQLFAWRFCHLALHELKPQAAACTRQRDVAFEPDRTLHAQLLTVFTIVHALKVCCGTHNYSTHVHPDYLPRVPEVMSPRCCTTRAMLVNLRPFAREDSGGSFGHPRISPALPCDSLWTGKRAASLRAVGVGNTGA